LIWNHSQPYAKQGKGIGFKRKIIWEDIINLLREKKLMEIREKGNEKPITVELEM